MKRSGPLKRSPLRSASDVADPRRCSDCGAPITKYSKTGRCKVCAMRVIALTGAGRRAQIAKNPHLVNAPRDKWGQVGVEQHCLICGEVFVARAGQVRKTCSRKCASALKRSRGGADRMGAANPNYRTGVRSGVHDRAGEERWRAALGTRCMAPDCQTPDGTGVQPLFLHHVCYRQHVRRAGGDVWDPRNAFTICNSCHSRHHQRTRILSVSVLPDAALGFAFALFGPYAVDYLRRYYLDDGDPRLLAMEAVAA